jgi:GTP cyclohydrolase IIa
MRYMREAHGALSFFVGGDNVISVVPEMSESEYQDAIDHVSDDVDVELKVGVGHGPTPHDAGIDAKHALEDCRYDGTRVEFADHE